MRSAASKLMEIFSTAPAHERIEIVAALNLIAAPGLLPFLKDRLADHDLETRRVASDGLARLAGPGRRRRPGGAVERRRLDGAQPRRLGPGPAGPARAARRALLQLCRDVEPVVARTARVALGKLGASTGAGPDWKAPSAAG